jgi:hypothetical protein
MPKGIVVSQMTRYLIRLLPLTVLAAFTAAAYLFTVRVSGLPFRALNDDLHRSGSPITLDLLIPAGVHIDEKMTVGEVARIRLRAGGGILERSMRHVAELIPANYRALADILIFLFWSFLYMVFLRVFTFAGYGRSIRMSLMAGGITYYFMPDFSPGYGDDILFLSFPFLLIASAYLLRRRRRAAEAKG